jgi:DNA-binding PadR family transcriptional regulator
MCSRCGCITREDAQEIRPAVIEGIFEPAVLATLARGGDHGYGLARTLAERGLMPREASRGRIYETLLRLERDGAIVGEREANLDGPDRRRYTVTTAGRRQLARWVVALEETEDVLARVLAAAAASIPALPECPASAGPRELQRT